MIKFWHSLVDEWRPARLNCFGDGGGGDGGGGGDAAAAAAAASDAGATAGGWDSGSAAQAASDAMAGVSAVGGTGFAGFDAGNAFAGAPTGTDAISGSMEGSLAGLSAAPGGWFAGDANTAAAQAMAGESNVGGIGGYSGWGGWGGGPEGPGVSGGGPGGWDGTGFAGGPFSGGFDNSWGGTLGGTGGFEGIGGMPGWASGLFGSGLDISSVPSLASDPFIAGTPGFSFANLGGLPGFSQGIQGDPYFGMFSTPSDPLSFTANVPTSTLAGMLGGGLLGAGIGTALGSPGIGTLGGALYGGVLGAGLGPASNTAVSVGTGPEVGGLNAGPFTAVSAPTATPETEQAMTEQAQTEQAQTEQAQQAQTEQAQQAIETALTSVTTGPESPGWSSPAVVTATPGMTATPSDVQPGTVTFGTGSLPGTLGDPQNAVTLSQVTVAPETQPVPSEPQPQEVPTPQARPSEAPQPQPEVPVPQARPSEAPQPQLPSVPTPQARPAEAPPGLPGPPAPPGLPGLSVAPADVANAQQQVQQAQQQQAAQPVPFAPTAPVLFAPSTSVSPVIPGVNAPMGPSGGGAGPLGGNIDQAQDRLGATRSQAISGRLGNVLQQAGRAAGVNVSVRSGGQPSTGKGRVGSHRHDNGMAADIQLQDARDGHTLNMNNPRDRAKMATFARAARAAGATGIGAGESYMGAQTMHVGFGKEATWGAKGQSSQAPGWLSQATAQGRADAQAGRGVAAAAAGAGAATMPAESEAPAPGKGGRAGRGARGQAGGVGLGNARTALGGRYTFYAPGASSSKGIEGPFTTARPNPDKGGRNIPTTMDDVFAARQAGRDIPVTVAGRGARGQVVSIGTVTWPSRDGQTHTLHDVKGRVIDTGKFTQGKGKYAGRENNYDIATIDGRGLNDKSAAPYLSGRGGMGVWAGTPQTGLGFTEPAPTTPLAPTAPVPYAPTAAPPPAPGRGPPVPPGQIAPPPNNVPNLYMQSFPEQGRDIPFAPTAPMPGEVGGPVPVDVAPSPAPAPTPSLEDVMQGVNTPGRQSSIGNTIGNALSGVLGIGSAQAAEAPGIAEFNSLGKSIISNTPPDQRGRAQDMFAKMSTKDKLDLLSGKTTLLDIVARQNGVSPQTVQQFAPQDALKGLEKAQTQINQLGKDLAGRAAQEKAAQQPAPVPPAPVPEAPTPTMFAPPTAPELSPNQLVAQDFAQLGQPGMPTWAQSVNLAPSPAPELSPNQVVAQDFSALAGQPSWSETVTPGGQPQTSVPNTSFESPMPGVDPVQQAGRDAQADPQTAQQIASAYPEAVANLAAAYFIDEGTAAMMLLRMHPPDFPPISAPAPRASGGRIPLPVARRRVEPEEGPGPFSYLPDYPNFNDEAWQQAVESWPISANIEDRRFNDPTKSSSGAAVSYVNPIYVPRGLPGQSVLRPGQQWPEPPSGFGQ